jgi:hypothetical protein
MLTDAAALALALIAAAVAGRPARGSWTFGFRRIEVIAALTNGITLVLVGIWIVFAAIRRLVAPPDVEGGLVLVVALAAIAPLLATGLADSGDRAKLRATQAVLDSRVPLRTKVPLALDMRDQFETAASGKIPDLDKPFADHGADSNADVARLRDDLTGAIASSLTRGFRPSFWLSALLAAAAALVGLAVGRRREGT